MQNAFANSSSSFVMGKVMGHIIDYLIPPLGALSCRLRFVWVQYFVELALRLWHLLPFLSLFPCLCAACFT